MRFCLTCHKEHEPTLEHPSCLHCYGLHEDTKSVVIYFKGWNFTAPFFCFCCGKQICAHQWAFGRACGGCDTGTCKHPYNQMGRKCYSGPRELVNVNDPLFIAPDRFIDILEEPKELREWLQRTPFKFPNKPVIPKKPVKFRGYHPRMT